MRREREIGNTINLGSRHPRQHHVVQIPWYRSVVAGGPYQSRAEAEIQAVKISAKEDKGVPQAGETVITYLEIGDKYVLRGSGDTQLEHGINDGLHGSELLKHPLSKIIASRLAIAR